MSVSVIVGGQYGSEGKGKVAYFWAKKKHATAAVRVGGSNSGHTVYVNGKRYAFRMLPTACLSENVVSILPAGAYIDLDVLEREIQQVNMAFGRLKIDPNAVIIKEAYKHTEEEHELRENIGSTLSGTGAAVVSRILRDKNDLPLMAKDVEELKPYITDTKLYMRNLLEHGEHIVVEGTQGYGLSNIHSKVYPYATSRDTSAAFFLAEAGLSPRDVEHVVMVIRAFPIRVAGNSGPLVNEIDWETVSRESGSTSYFEEYTTVTNKKRRVARFDSDIVREAICVNQPDVIVMNHIDYIDKANMDQRIMTEAQQRFVNEIERLIKCDIDYCGNGTMSLIGNN